MKIEEIKKQREFLVVKSNHMIQKSRFNLSAQEQKIILYIISKIKPDDSGLFELEFSIKEFCKVCGINETSGKNYSSVKKTIKNLRDKSFWLKLDDKTEVTVSWINKAYIIKNDGTIKLRLDDDLKPYLLCLKEKYTQYSLIHTLAMSSKYSIRLYEILKSHEWKRNCEIEIENLKKMLSAEKYKSFKDFRIKVFEIAISEIEDYSDLKIDYEYIKTGRKYTKIKFFIKSRSEIQENLLTYQRINNKLNNFEHQSS